MDAEVIYDAIEVAADKGQLRAAGHRNDERGRDIAMRAAKHVLAERRNLWRRPDRAAPIRSNDRIDQS